MLTEVKAGKTHVQLFHGDVCVATVRVEYAYGVKCDIEEQISYAEQTKGVPIANRDDTKET